MVIMEKYPAKQKVKATENRFQEGVIGFACLTFFPLVYFVGKTILSLIK